MLPLLHCSARQITHSSRQTTRGHHGGGLPGFGVPLLSILTAAAGETGGRGSLHGSLSSTTVLYTLLLLALAYCTRV